MKLNEIPWVIQEQTRIKHDLLSKYISPWMKILFKTQESHNFAKQLFYFDGFSGPGSYYEDETRTVTVDGSPLIVADIANLYIKQDSERKVSMYCIDKEEQCTSRLETLLKTHNQFGQDWLVFQGSFECEMPKLLDLLEVKHLTDYPIFVFVDHFGYGGFPLRLLSRIMTYPRVELFINLMVYDIIRFLNDPGKKNVLDALFGSDDYAKECIDASEANKPICLVNLYCRNLIKLANAKYVMPFRINTPEQGKRPRYYLIHASKSYTAFKLMKDIMHRKSDSSFSFEAIGVKSDQMSLFEEPDKIDLRNRLLSFIEMNKQQMTDYSNAERWAYENTNGVNNTIKHSLMELEHDGNIKILRLKGQRTNTVVTGAKLAFIKGMT
ncbi:MAG: three-Cys-motif partner protein TcmP [Spirochaetia bacterium]